MNNNILLNAKILVVDDSFETLSLLGAILTRESFVVFPASNGNQAVAIALNKKPDLILLDISMQGKDGFKVCKEIKEKPEIASIPVIFLTGKSDTDDIVKGLNCGAVDFITKPFNQAELIARINTHIRLVKYQEKLIEQQSLLHAKEMELMQNEKEKAEAIAVQNEKELTGLTLRVSKAGKLMEQFIDELYFAIASMSEKDSGNITKIINEYKTRINMDNWRNIETMFLNLHSNFFNKLLDEYPDLSKNELKLCAMIRLNLTTKDIASITLQSEETIKKARYRLRNKLNMETEESLLNLILQF